ncbi:hypothetical protein D9615_006135 [Tricholomella constricta]|uniref:Uncharacterized protein n=1 Tax=Tricholomella constricta TaxID=117010 RepID=A0A8H5HB63_9AGAR|nr:hypothetical protein D9615_006135 [Tricholomella constricta]
MSSHPRQSHSPPIRSESSYAATGPHPQQPLMQQSPAYPGVGNVVFGPQPPTNSYEFLMTNRNTSPDSNSSGSSTFNDPMFNGGQYSLHPNSSHGAGFPVDPYQLHPSSPTNDERLKSEINQLRQRVHDLEAERARNYAALGARETSTVYGHGGLATPPPSASFVASWKARTDSRKRVFCALNRAGNALCAWHDSRRERRAHPPRNAPPGYLNCGCTHEEALFEESLARHNVGSYHPGENVRMDPALRNPLLKLLQHRYGYQDGDFERNPITGDWVEGEGAAYWEQQAQAHVSGSSSRRRVDTDRH